MTTTDDIDYEALAKAARQKMTKRYFTEDVARAVVAALRDQGLVVVSRVDAEIVLDWCDQYQMSTPSNVMAAVDRMIAALAAPGDGREGTND